MLPATLMQHSSPYLLITKAFSEIAETPLMHHEMNMQLATAAFLQLLLQVITARPVTKATYVHPSINLAS